MPASCSSIKLWAILLTALLLAVQQVSGAWQEITDYADCGSKEFALQKILVNLGDGSSSYSLNISIVGDFNDTIQNAKTSTNLASTSPPPQNASLFLLMLTNCV